MTFIILVILAGVLSDIVISNMKKLRFFSDKFFLRQILWFCMFFIMLMPLIAYINPTFPGADKPVNESSSIPMAEVWNNYFRFLIIGAPILLLLAYFLDNIIHTIRKKLKKQI